VGEGERIRGYDPNLDASEGNLDPTSSPPRPPFDPTSTGRFVARFALVRWGAAPVGSADVSVRPLGTAASGGLYVARADAQGPDEGVCGCRRNAVPGDGDPS
jgi:hypothetical protein